MRSSSAETPSALRKCGSCKERKPAESSDAKAGRPSVGLRRKAQRTDRRTDDPAFRMKPETPRPGRNDESGGRSPSRRTPPRAPERTLFARKRLRFFPPPQRMQQVPSSPQAAPETAFRESPEARAASILASTSSKGAKPRATACSSPSSVFTKSVG